MPVLGSGNVREIVAKAVPLSNRALYVNPVVNVTAASTLQCAKFCIQHQCQSFNFAKPSTCELLDTYLCRENVVLEVRFGYMYFDVEWGDDVRIANDFRQLSDCINQGRCSPKCCESE
ncbi:hypothetical protein ACJMK2_009957 [Sinanodonta woodiana]|uniref:Apple domain-containing protein n=1 Tax=Sinanodonta woodiana TaxID=1069815 RepID=A0ABD3VDV0_SINWO